MHWSCDEDTLSTRLTREYRLRYPFVSAGMGFVAHPALAAAVSNAGGLGVVGASPDPPPSLPVMVGELRSLTDRPWGVDLICAASTEAAAHPEYQRRLVEARSGPMTTTAFGPEWPGQRYHLLPTRTVAEWAGREDEIPDPAPGPEIIGHTTLFPHSVALPYDMPKFSAIPPGPDTTGDWDEMAYPAGDGVNRIHDIRPAGQIITDMMTEACELLGGRKRRNDAPT